jgi:divinyl chlorophyllide a 8-vinyl-reductase
MGNVGIEGAAPRRRRTCLLGATGTIGRATLRALVARGDDVVCFLRPRDGRTSLDACARTLGIAGADAATLRFVDFANPVSLATDGFCGEAFDAIVSCMASRTGAPQDAWAVDYKAQLNVLAAGCDAGVEQVVLLSAICVQKPRLAFQHAKLAFEAALASSRLTYSIVRPTAYFKSLSGQIDRLKRGKPFLVFGDGTLTACKPISDADLGRYLVDCLDDTCRWNKILPIGGPGPAITPLEQGDELFRLLGKPPRFRHVPLAMLDVIIGGLKLAGRVVPSLADKAELARIGRYYASESMLLLDPATGRYDADLTPSTGSETLYAYYAALVAGTATLERGDHAVF